MERHKTADTESGAGMSSIDETRIVNGELPKTWTCPHCGKRNKMGRYKADEFIEFGKAFQHCAQCSYVHYWELVLTDDFKQGVIDMLLKETGGKV